MKNRKLLILFSALFLILFLRILYIQIFQHNRLYQEKQSYVGKLIVGKRGDIFDRNGIKLTDTIQTTSIYANPKKIKDAEKTIEILSKYVEFYRDNKEYKMIMIKVKVRNFIWIARQVDDKIADEIKKLRIKGIHFIKEPKRYYPYKSTASHLLGFCGIDVQGLSGLEKIYENHLKGKFGLETYYKDIYGNPIPNSCQKMGAEDGKNIITTIDFKLQKEIENILDLSIKKHKWDKGSVIIFSPKTGEILALSVRPNFDPNNFLKYPKEVWERPIVYKEFKIQTGIDKLNEILLKLRKFGEDDIDKLAPNKITSLRKSIITPSDLVKIISLIANNGDYIKLRLVKEIRDNKGKIIKKIRGKRKEKIINEKELEYVKRVLWKRELETRTSYGCDYKEINVENLLYKQKLTPLDNSKYVEIIFNSYLKLSADKKPEYAIIFIIEDRDDQIADITQELYWDVGEIIDKIENLKRFGFNYEKINEENRQKRS